MNSGDVSYSWDWEQLESRYACPTLISPTESEHPQGYPEPELREISWFIHRAAQRAAKAPVHENDVESKNVIFCEPAPGDYYPAADRSEPTREDYADWKAITAAAQVLAGQPIVRVPNQHHAVAVRRADGTGPIIVAYWVHGNRICLGDVWD